MRKKILIVEDESTLGEILRDKLSVDYDTIWVTHQAAAIEQLRKTNFDLLILDIGLPDGDGFSIAKSLFAGGLSSSIKPKFLFLTAQSDPETRLRGFEAGADEFIPKPFHLKEVLIRVQHVLNVRNVQLVLELEHCSVDLSSYAVHFKNGNIEYPPIKDMQILKLLVEQAPQVVSRDEIINRVWGEEKELSPRTIDNAIARLRQILSDLEENKIRSVRGIGYQWVYIK
jgi:two-component system, OmpR family, phosphate regulon response regulator PhoB